MPPFRFRNPRGKHVIEEVRFGDQLMKEKMVVEHAIEKSMQRMKHSPHFMWGIKFMEKMPVVEAELKLMSGRWDVMSKPRRIRNIDKEKLLAEIDQLMIQTINDAPRYKSIIEDVFNDIMNTVAHTNSAQEKDTYLKSAETAREFFLDANKYNAKLTEEAPISIGVNPNTGKQSVSKAPPFDVVSNSVKVDGKCLVLKLHRARPGIYVYDKATSDKCGGSGSNNSSKQPNKQVIQNAEQLENKLKNILNVLEQNKNKQEDIIQVIATSWEQAIQNYKKKYEYSRSSDPEPQIVYSAMLSELFGLRNGVLTAWNTNHKFTKQHTITDGFNCIYNVSLGEAEYYLCTGKLGELMLHAKKKGEVKPVPGTPITIQPAPGTPAKPIKTLPPKPNQQQSQVAIPGGLVL